MDISTLISPDSIVFKIVIALFLGLFIGLRREIDIQKEGSESFVGFRTLPLIVVLGAISTLIPSIPYLPAVALIGVLVFLAIAYYNGAFKLQLIGLTSEFATLIMFLVGVFVGTGEYIVAILLTVAIGLLTGFKSQLHSFAKNISPQEWGGALQLLILSAVVLPFLPTEAIDPWGVLIPFDVWLLVIFISGIGFVGYFFNKYIDSKKGLVVTSFLGALISSTAVTTALAIKAKQKKDISKDLFIVALLVAIGTMLGRTIFTILLIAPVALKVAAIIPAAMLVADLLLLFFFIKKNTGQDHVDIVPELESPFELLPALKFGGLFVVVLFAVAFGMKYLGDYGVLITAFLSGFVDVDATILSSLQTFKTAGIGKTLAVQAITMAIVINTLVKVLYVWILSRRDVAKLSTLVIGAISVVGIGVFVLI